MWEYDAIGILQTIVTVRKMKEEITTFRDADMNNSNKFAIQYFPFIFIFIFVLLLETIYFFFYSENTRKSITFFH